MRFPQLIAFAATALSLALRKPRGKGKLLRVGAAGANRISFSRRVAKHRLRPGRYRVRVVAIDGAGNRSKVRYAKFRVKR